VIIPSIIYFITKSREVIAVLFLLKSHELADYTQLRNLKREESYKSFSYKYYTSRRCSIKGER